MGRLLLLKINKKYKVIFLLSISILVFFSLFIVTEIYFQNKKSINLLNFEHDLINQNIILKFSRPLPVTYVSILEKVPENITFDNINTVKLSEDTDIIKLPLTAEQQNQEHSFILFSLPKLCESRVKVVNYILKSFSICKPKHFIEIIRQPENFLSNSYKFTKPLGYSILGRRTIEPAHVKPKESRKITFKGVPTLDFSNILLDSELEKKLRYKDLKLATKIINYLWDYKILTGPIKFPYDDFLKSSFKEKLELLANNKHSVMCAGFRDLFLHASVNIFKARSVDAYSHSEISNDLITYSHALAEIWVPEIKKWVIVDPWLAVVFQNIEGDFISSEDLKKTKDYSSIKVISLKEIVVRNLINNQNQQYQINWKPHELKINKWNVNSINAAPGYSDYFKEIVYGSYEINEL